MRALLGLFKQGERIYFIPNRRLSNDPCGAHDESKLYNNSTLGIIYAYIKFSIANVMTIFFNRVGGAVVHSAFCGE